MTHKLQVEHVHIKKDSSGKWQKSSINWFKQKSIGSGDQEVVNDINITND